MQREAAARPESVRVQTPTGEVWMSPIEVALYEAMRREGLSPLPQFYIQGYYVDFAFPDVGVAVEADGAAYHEGVRQQRDRKRDWILRRAGWIDSLLDESFITLNVSESSRLRAEELGLIN